MKRLNVRTQASAMGENFQQSVKQILRDYAEALVIAVALAIVLRLFVISAYKIPTENMAPTLVPGDYIFAYKMPYSFRSLNFVQGGTPHLPHRGQVIVFKCLQNPKRSCVKRVLGLPGDLLEIYGKRLRINGDWASYKPTPLDLDGFITKGERAALREVFPQFSQTVIISGDQRNENYGPIVVPPGHVFVLADNRDGMEDSRVWGPIPLRNIEAEALFIWMSADWKNLWAGERLPGLRWERIFRAVR